MALPRIVGLGKGASIEPVCIVSANSLNILHNSVHLPGSVKEL